jgi:cytochrome c biogenesis protein CcmG/thiol:disulfide interchange protein DsbE
VSARVRVNWPALVGGSLVVALLIALFASGFGKDPHRIPSVLVGRAAPPFALTTLDGAPVSTEQLRGRPVIVNFWSTWCQPCKLEHPYLQDAARAFPDVVFLGVLYGDEPEKARRYLRQVGSAYPTVADPGGRMAIDYGVTGVPETFFITADGTILEKVNGAVPPDLLQSLVARLRAP